VTSFGTNRSQSPSYDKEFLYASRRDVIRDEAHASADKIIQLVSIRQSA